MNWEVCWLMAAVGDKLLVITPTTA